MGVNVVPKKTEKVQLATIRFSILKHNYFALVWSCVRFYDFQATLFINCCPDLFICYIKNFLGHIFAKCGPTFSQNPYVMGVKGPTFRQNHMSWGRKKNSRDPGVSICIEVFNISRYMFWHQRCSTGRDVTGRDGMGRDGTVLVIVQTGRDGMGRDGTGRF